MHFKCDEQETKVTRVHKDVQINLRTKPGEPSWDTIASRSNESVNPIRVTHFPEDTTENDLHDLFRHFGNISTINLSINRSTNKSRGYAFITYTNYQDAQKAINRLNGYGYGNMIMHVEWSTPQEEGEFF